MKPLNIKGRVGENVTVKCNKWNVWTDVERSTKYFCHSPCRKEEHIIIKASPGQTVQEERIQIFNNKETLHVTFIKLQKSDSKKYYCGVHRVISDPLIEVNLEVTDAESSSEQLQSTTSSSDFISDTSTSHIIYSTAATATNMTTTSTSSSTQGSGMVLYLIICVIVIITLLMVLLTLIRKITRKQLKKEEERVDAGNGQSLNQPAVISTFHYSADSDGLYANYTELAAESGNNYSKDFPLNAASSSGVSLKGTRAERRVTDPQCDMMYSVIQLPKKQTEPTVQSEPNQSEYTENDSLYSLAQLPKTNSM